jgi:hypothetical protein
MLRRTRSCDGWRNLTFWIKCAGRVSPVIPKNSTYRWRKTAPWVTSEGPKNGHEEKARLFASCRHVSFTSKTSVRRRWRTFTTSAMAGSTRSGSSASPTPNPVYPRLIEVNGRCPPEDCGEARTRE